MKGAIVFVLWCGQIMFVGTNEAYYHINSSGIVTVLLQIKVCSNTNNLLNFFRRSLLRVVHVSVLVELFLQDRVTPSLLFLLKAEWIHHWDQQAGRILLTQ